MGAVTKYKNFEIEYDDRRDDFYVEDNQGNDIIRRKSVVEVKKAIDAHRLKAFKRVNVWQLNGDRFRKVTITSITPEDECWISCKEGRSTSREKVWRRGALYLDNDKNRKLTSRFNDIQDDRDTLEKKQDRIANQIEKYQVKVKE